MLAHRSTGLRLNFMPPLIAIVPRKTKKMREYKQALNREARRIYKELRDGAS